MKTVTVNKVDLLSRLQENKEIHKAAHVEAFEGWVIETHEKLQTAINDLEEDSKSFETLYVEGPPRNYLDEYDTAINMLNWSTEDEIDLDYQSFRQYVEDDWNWKQSWSLSNSGYIAKFKSSSH